jgi:hypothetical protein
MLEAILYFYGLLRRVWFAFLDKEPFTPAPPANSSKVDSGDFDICGPSDA